MRVMYEGVMGVKNNENNTNNMTMFMSRTISSAANNTNSRFFNNTNTNPNQNI